MTTLQTAGRPWGASVGDWQAFAHGLGLCTDLLPVVSNPGAVISPASKMRDLGKTPSRYDGSGLVVGIPKWTAHQSAPRDIDRWAAQPDLGICVQTRRVRAIDIDISDPARAAEVEELISFMVDLPARRRANSGKCLLLLDMPGEFSKRVIKTEHGIIEFLATGQQFIAVGTHPSGARYEWDGGIPAAVPVVAPAEFEVLWQALADAFALPGGAHDARPGMPVMAPRSAADINDPVVAWLDAQGWVTGYERDGRVDVRCPWEGGHSTDSGPTATSWFPAGVGGFDQGHFHCLHASCNARTDADFLSVTGHTQSAFEVIVCLPNGKGSDPGPLPVFERDGRGSPLAVINNVLAACRRPDVIGRRLGVDRFLCALMTSEDGAPWRRFAEEDYTRVRSTLATLGFKPVAPEMIKVAVKLVAREFAFDSAIDWLNSLEWDGVERIDTFYPDHYSVPDTPYTRAVSTYTWTALAGRCLVPGVKADMAPVLIGTQGRGKTSAVEVMAPFHTSEESAFVEINLTKKDEDIARSLRGKLVGEIAELRGLQTRDAESIKAWVSRQYEEWTPKYEEFGTRFARRLLLIGSGNKNFLDDETGERRWLPMRVGAVDIRGVAAARDQLWAEGAHRFRRSGVAWQDAEALAADEHADFKLTDAWDDHVSGWLSRDAMDGDGGVPRSAGRVRMSDVLSSALRIDVSRQSRSEEMRVAKILTRLGFERKSGRIGGIVCRWWAKPADYSEFA